MGKEIKRVLARHLTPRKRERMMQARSVSRATTVCSARPRTVKVSAVSRPNRLSEAKAVLKKELPKIEAAAIVGAATLTASPALALVDKRMNGDGTRLFLGINDPILGFILVSVFGGKNRCRRPPLSQRH